MSNRPSLFTSAKVAPNFQIFAASPLSPTPALSVTSSNLKLPRLRKRRHDSVLLTTKISGLPSLSKSPIATPVPMEPPLYCWNRAPFICGSAYWFSVRTPVASGGSRVNMVFPGGPERGFNLCPTKGAVSNGTGLVWGVSWAATRSQPRRPKPTAAAEDRTIISRRFMALFSVGSRSGAAAASCHTPYCNRTRKVGGTRLSARACSAGGMATPNPRHKTSSR